MEIKPKASLAALAAIIAEGLRVQRTSRRGKPYIRTSSGKKSKRVSKRRSYRMLAPWDLRMVAKYPRQTKRKKRGAKKAEAAHV